MLFSLRVWRFPPVSDVGYLGGHSGRLAFQAIESKGSVIPPADSASSGAFAMSAASGSPGGSERAEFPIDRVGAIVEYPEGLVAGSLESWDEALAVILPRPARSARRWMDYVSNRLKRNGGGALLPRGLRTSRLPFPLLRNSTRPTRVKRRSGSRSLSAW